MTSDELVGMCANYRLYRQEAVPFNPEEVYPAGNFAQDELLDELSLLEDTCNLKLVAAQEQYRSTPVDITDCTNATPIQVTAPGHGRHTGDTVVVGGVEGNDAANGRWNTVTVIDANTLTLDGSVGNGTYISGGILYPGLVAASSIRSIRKLTSPYGSIVYKSKEDVETDRALMQSASNNTNVVHYYPIFDDPIILGFSAVPGGDLAIEINYYRRAIPPEFISADVDPIIPSQYGKALYLGTLFELLDKNILKEARSDAKDLKAQYEEEKKRIRLILARRRMPKYEAAEGMRLK